MSRPGSLSLRHVGKHYVVEGRALAVLENVSLQVPGGSFVSMVGPSGCGKSTLLRLVVGLERPGHGEILLDGAPVRGTGPECGLVFQDHRLLPWLTLEQNVALALEGLGTHAVVRREVVQDAIDLVGLSGFERAFPHQLSGGMAQRGAIARGLVRAPKILLLDEPLGALDAMTRHRLQDELRNLWRSRGVTMVLVTHDVEEAIYLSDAVLVMQPRPGRIVRRIDITLPHPRDRTDAAFGEMRRQVLAAMGAHAAADVLGGGMRADVALNSTLRR